MSARRAISFSIAHCTPLLLLALLTTFTHKIRCTSLNTLHCSIKLLHIIKYVNKEFTVYMYSCVPFHVISKHTVPCMAQLIVRHEYCFFLWVICFSSSVFLILFDFFQVILHFYISAHCIYAIAIAIASAWCVT